MISPVIDIEYTFYPRPKVVFETFPKLFINCIVDKGIRCAVRVDTDLAQSYYTIRVFCFASVIKVKPQKDDVIGKHEEREDDNNHSKNLHDFVGFFLLVALKGIV